MAKAEKTPEEVKALEQFNVITEAASALMDAGEMDIYSAVRRSCSAPRRRMLTRTTCLRTLTRASPIKCAPQAALVPITPHDMVLSCTMKLTPCPAC